MAYKSALLDKYPVPKIWLVVKYKSAASSFISLKEQFRQKFSKSILTAL
jgi:hypothetical protein